MSNSVMSRKEYGRIRLQIAEYLEAHKEEIKNINQLAKRADTYHTTITKWRNGDISSLDLDVLARICFALDCQPGDLLVYEGPKGKVDSE